MTNHRPRRIVLGVGNPDRGDDDAGRAVARLLRGMLLSIGNAREGDVEDEIEVAEHDGEAASVLARIEGVSEAYLVDACISGLPSGTVQRFDVTTMALPQGVLGLSTHGFGLAAGVELGRTLGQLPPRCIIYAIEGHSFETGAAMSPEVAAAVAEAATRLYAEIAPKMQDSSR